MQEEEIWKDVVGYEGLYQVSNLGRIRSVERYIKIVAGKKGRLAKQKILKQFELFGYLKCTLSKGGVRRQFFTHRIVAFAFIENPKNKKQIDHIDRDKKNNEVSNLRWVSARENSVHRSLETNKFNEMGAFKRPNGRYFASVFFKGKNIKLGDFDTAEEANRYYIRAISEINKGVDDIEHLRKKRVPKGCMYNKNRPKTPYQAVYNKNKKRYHLGNYATMEEVAEARRNFEIKMGWND